MSTPTIKRGKTVVQPAEVCPRCTPHLLSDHVEEKARQCNKCACVAQDVHDTKS